MFEIQNNIVPPPSKRAKGTSIYPFSSMASGDSILVPFERAASAKAAAISFAKNAGMKCITRKEMDGLRVWLFDAK